MNGPLPQENPHRNTTRCHPKSRWILKNYSFNFLPFPGFVWQKPSFSHCSFSCFHLSPTHSDSRLVLDLGSVLAGVCYPPAVGFDTPRGRSQLAAIAGIYLLSIGNPRPKLEFSFPPCHCFAHSSMLHLDAQQSSLITSLWRMAIARSRTSMTSERAV